MTGQELLDFLMSCSPELLAREVLADYEGFDIISAGTEPCAAPLGETGIEHIFLYDTLSPDRG